MSDIHFLLSRITFHRRFSRGENWAASLRLDHRPWAWAESRGPIIQMFKDSTVSKEDFDPLYEQIRAFLRRGGWTISHLLGEAEEGESLLESYSRL